MKFSIVTVCYRQEQHIVDFLSSVGALESPEVQLDRVIIVDNYGSCEVEAAAFPNINVEILKSSNVGYLRGLGIGVNQALKQSVDFVILCNPDLKFMSRIEDNVSLALRDLWVVAPQIVDLDGAQQNPNRTRPFSLVELVVWEVMMRSYLLYQVIPKLKSIFKYLAHCWKDSIDLNKCAPDGPIFLPHGSCMLMSASLLRRADFFREQIFLWGEEAIIGGIAREVGPGVTFISSLKVEHASHSATSKIPTKEKYLIWRSSWNIYKKYLYKR